MESKILAKDKVTDLVKHLMAKSAVLAPQNIRGNIEFAPLTGEPIICAIEIVRRE